MDTIRLQEKTKAKPASIESYWFENPNIGLPKTRFHRIRVPLESFDSGLEYDEQPLETAIEFDWFALKLGNPAELGGLNLSHEHYPDAEASIYVGCAHNWCQIKELLLEDVGANQFKATGAVIVEFENEMVGKNEPFTFATLATYREA